jgi:predicted transcriptional regulator
MGSDSDGVPGGALEDVAYLARSVNRVRLLDILASGSYTRRDLADRTEIARTTVGRIVNELEERGWAKRTTDGEYAATPTGEQITTEFVPFVESIAVIREFGKTVAWFQDVDQPIGLHHLRDATVWRPDATDPMAPTVAYMDDLRTAREFHCLVGVAPPVSFEKAMLAGVVDRGMRVEHVISEDEYSYLRDDPERVPRWREYIRAGANVYRYDGTVPCNFVILDETVYIAKSQSDYGKPYTVIESDDDVVRSWAHEVIDQYRVESEQLDAEAFVR